MKDVLLLKVPGENASIAVHSVEVRLGEMQLTIKAANGCFHINGTADSMADRLIITPEGGNVIRVKVGELK